jgi:phage terminase large subunit GpA-like protein
MSDPVLIRERDSYELNPMYALMRRVRSGFAPPPNLTVSQYSDEKIILTNGPLAGTRWRTTFAPYQRGIMDVFHEDGVTHAVVQGSSQWGKTAICVNIAAYHVDYDPCTILIVEPTLDPMAKDFAKNRLEPVIAASPSLQAKVAKKRAKDSSNTLLSKTFRGGAISIAGANSASSLAARPVRLLILDEVDRYPKSLPGEGSTIAIAMKRTQSYRQRKRVFMCSSPTIKGGTVDVWYQRGDQRKYHVPCHSCGHMHPYEWQNVMWENDDSSTAHLVCPECDAIIDDAMRIALLEKGEWIATNNKHREKNIVSFHMWEAYSPMSSLSEIVAAFMRARELQKTGDTDEMDTWQNTTLAEAREPLKIDGFDGNQVLQRCEDYDENPDVHVPEGACCITMGVDIQDSRIEALVYAWGPGEESWIIDRHEFPGDTTQPEAWASLDQLLDAQYLHATGQTLSISSTCIDSAGHRTNMVYDFCSKRSAQRVYAIIGRDGQRPIVSSPSRKRWGRGERECDLYTVGVDSAKSLFLKRLQLTEKGPGFIHLPRADWCDVELAEQLTSERPKTKFSKGLPHTAWVKTRLRNEGLDMSVYAIAALRLLNPKLNMMLDILRRGKSPQGSGSAPAPPAPRSRRRISHSNYLSR